MEELRFVDLLRAVLRADVTKVSDILGEVPKLVHRKLEDGSSLINMVQRLLKADSIRIGVPSASVREEALLSIQSLLSETANA